MWVSLSMSSGFVIWDFRCPVLQYNSCYCFTQWKEKRRQTFLRNNVFLYTALLLFYTKVFVQKRRKAIVLWSFVILARMESKIETEIIDCFSQIIIEDFMDTSINMKQKITKLGLKKKISLYKTTCSRIYFTLKFDLLYSLEEFIVHKHNTLYFTYLKICIHLSLNIKSTLELHRWGQTDNTYNSYKLSVTFTSVSSANNFQKDDYR